MNIVMLLLGALIGFVVSFLVFAILLRASCWLIGCEEPSLSDGMVTAFVLSVANVALGFLGFFLGLLGAIAGREGGQQVDPFVLILSSFAVNFLVNTVIIHICIGVSFVSAILIQISNAFLLSPVILLLVLAAQR